MACFSIYLPHPLGLSTKLQPPTCHTMSQKQTQPTRYSAFECRLHYVRQALALPLLVLPGTTSRHNLLDSLLASHLLLQSTGQDSLSDTSKLDDYALLITVEAVQVLVPSTQDPMYGKIIANCPPSVVFHVPKFHEQFGNSVDGGIAFRKRVLRIWLDEVPRVNLCVPPGYEEPEEVLDRYKIFDGSWYEGEVADASRKAWKLLTR